MNCENCGEETHKIYGFWHHDFGWICFECYNELKDEMEE